MPAKVLVLSLDAVETTLVDRWIGEGRLPTLASLAGRGAQVELESSLDLLPGTIWQEIATGRAAASLGWYWAPWQVHPGEAHFRGNGPDDFDIRGFWRHAAGRSVAVIDVPFMTPQPGLDGVQVSEWGTHEKPFGAASEPPGYLRELEARYGTHPVPHLAATRTSCDDHDGTLKALGRLQAGLVEGAELRGRLLRDVLDSREWDLFFACLTEGHCAGHQLWHLLDPASPWHEPHASEVLKMGIRDVYEQLDASLAHVLEGAADDAVRIVLLSHGMGPIGGGPQLLPEVLVRLGYGSGAGTASRVRGRLPPWARRLARAVVRGKAKRRLQAAAGSLRHPLESPATRAVAADNGSRGGVRLNLEGRDPFGSVEPGAEYEAAVEELMSELMALENAETGTPAVESVVRADEAFGELRHPAIPDLIVRFHPDQPPIEAVRSPRVGTVRAPVRAPNLPRTGDHVAHSRLWAFGPGIPPGGRLSGHVVDVAATTLDLLGVQAPDSLHGKPLSLRSPV